MKYSLVCWVPWATSDKCSFTSCSNNNSNSNERPVLLRFFDGDGSSSGRSGRAGTHGAGISMWISIAEVGLSDVEPIYNLRKFVKIWTQNNIFSEILKWHKARRERTYSVMFQEKISFSINLDPTIHHSPGSNSHIPVRFPCLSWTFSFVDKAVPKNKFDLKSSVHTADVSILYIIYLKQMCAWLRVWCLLSLNRIHVSRHVPISYTITYYVYIHLKEV